MIPGVCEFSFRLVLSVGVPAYFWLLYIIRTVLSVYNTYDTCVVRSAYVQSVRMLRTWSQVVVSFVLLVSILSENGYQVDRWVSGT